MTFSGKLDYMKGSFLKPAAPAIRCVNAKYHDELWTLLSELH